MGLMMVMNRVSYVNSFNFNVRTLARKYSLRNECADLTLLHVVDWRVRTSEPFDNPDFRTLTLPSTNTNFIHALFEGYAVYSQYFSRT